MQVISGAGCLKSDHLIWRDSVLLIALEESD